MILGFSREREIPVVEEKKFLATYPKSKFNRNRQSFLYADFITGGEYHYIPSKYKAIKKSYHNPAELSSKLVITHTNENRFYIGIGWEYTRKGEYYNPIAETKGEFVNSDGNMADTQEIIKMIKNRKKGYTKYLDFIVNSFHDYIDYEVYKATRDFSISKNSGPFRLKLIAYRIILNQLKEEEIRSGKYGDDLINRLDNCYCTTSGVYLDLIYNYEKEKERMNINRSLFRIRTR